MNVKPMLHRQNDRNAKRALILSETGLRIDDGAGLQFPYDADLLEEHGFSLQATKVTSNPFLAKIRDVFEHRTGILAEASVRGLTARTDIVIALLEQYAVAPSIMKGLMIPPYGSAPLVLLSCWLAEVASKSDANQRALLAKRFNRADLICYLSRNQTDIFTEMGIPPHKLAPVPFGVNADFFSPEASIERDIPILAVGQDRGRDYGTLFKALQSSQLSADLVCKPVNLNGLTPSHNVKLHGKVDYTSYRNLLRRAQIVVVPTYELAYPTGQTVAMEAAASGACVVVTNTQPMSEYFQHGRNALMVAPQDPLGLREALELATNDPALRLKLGEEARSHILKNFTTRHLWDAVAKAIADRNLLS